MLAKLSAEFIGTFWLVLGGCGSAVLAAAFPNVGIGLHGVSLAFGLTVLSGAYALGPISGGHFNPAVSVGLWAGGRFPAALLVPYVVAQVAGAVIGAGVLYVIASGNADFSDFFGGDHEQQVSSAFEINIIDLNRAVIAIDNCRRPRLRVHTTIDERKRLTGAVWTTD